MNTAKGAGGALIALSALFADHQVRVALCGLAVLFGMDTAAGIWLAGLKGELASWKMSRMLVSKIFLFGTIITPFMVAALLSGSTVALLSGLAVLGYIEVLSLHETALRLETHAGVNLGPVKPYLDRIRKYFAAGLEPAEKGNDHGS